MRLIDADAIPYKKIMYDDDDFYYGVTQPYIDRMPTIDAVPVVRCRECKFNGNFPEIPLCCYVNYPNFERNGDGYCSMGQRREDGDA